MDLVLEPKLSRSIMHPRMAGSKRQDNSTGGDMAVFRIAVFVGSLRKEAYSRKMANAMIALAPATLVPGILEIGQLPLYNEDLEAAPPETWTAFRAKLKASEGVLFVTPEYNRSVPAALKNAIDVASRPKGQNVWDGKPGAVVSISAGGISGFGGHHHIRQMLVCLNVPAMAGPEAYIGNVGKLFDESGVLVNESTKGFLTTFMTSFEQWVVKNVH
jgi:chromate reductase, NAD(P)H dehydrogenase (quinone)